MWMSYVAEEQEMLEEVKKTAVKQLQQEQYDAGQVQQAYVEKRRKALEKDKGKLCLGRANELLGDGEELMPW